MSALTTDESRELASACVSMAEMADEEDSDGLLSFYEHNRALLAAALSGVQQPSDLSPHLLAYAMWAAHCEPALVVRALQLRVGGNLLKPSLATAHRRALEAMRPAADGTPSALWEAVRAVLCDRDATIECNNPRSVIDAWAEFDRQLGIALHLLHLSTHRSVLFAQALARIGSASEPSAPSVAPQAPRPALPTTEAAQTRVDATRQSTADVENSREHDKPSATTPSPSPVPLATISFTRSAPSPSQPTRPPLTRSLPPLPVLVPPMSAPSPPQPSSAANVATVPSFATDGLSASLFHSFRTASEALRATSALNQDIVGAVDFPCASAVDDQSGGEQAHNALGSSNSSSYHSDNDGEDYTDSDTCDDDDEDDDYTDARRKRSLASFETNATLAADPCTQHHHLLPYKPKLFVALTRNFHQRSMHGADQVHCQYRYCLATMTVTTNSVLRKMMRTEIWLRWAWQTFFCFRHSKMELPQLQHQVYCINCLVLENDSQPHGIECRQYCENMFRIRLCARCRLFEHVQCQLRAVDRRRIPQIVAEHMDTSDETALSAQQSRKRHASDQ